MFSLQSPRAFIGLTPGARRRLMQIPWAGNVRELRNVIERAFLLSDSECITEQNIAHMYELARCQSSMGAPVHFQIAPKRPPPHSVSRTSYRYSKVNSSETSELEHIRKTLEETHWNKSEAAKLLRCSRMTLYRKGVQYQLHSCRSSN